jgi:hypothetical protein
MEKKFTTSDEAQHYQSLYNTFPHHVQGKGFGNIFKYDYIPWEERYTVVQEKIPMNLSLFREFWDILWKFHFERCKITNKYEKICSDRGYWNDASVFLASNYYFWTIHGDLHLRNIIIHNKQIHILDRLSETGDILMVFDLSYD